ncbi:MAG: hypothetical protein HF978_06555 [Desulfobacteraceae bacterium]|nr:hypothetical protein [Desulfobacteraceae bacterium]MBC2755192.1 hypothetical protein [Desulfobacteraceae bacterium]
MNNSINLPESMKSIQHILCEQCTAEHAGVLTKMENKQRKFKLKDREAEDIHKLHHKRCAKQYDLLASLDKEKKENFGMLVMSVQKAAEKKASEAVSDVMEESLLFDILIAAAWEAAVTYDSSVAKFSTWVRKPWEWSINRFWEVKRLTTQSISAPIKSKKMDSGGEPMTVESIIKDENTLSPLEVIETADITAMTQAAFHNQISLTTVVDSLWYHKNWPCVYCRRDLFLFFQSQSIETSEKRAFDVSIPHIYSRRQLWKDICTS